MEIFEVNSLVFLGILFAVGIALAPILQVTRLMNLLIASYIALCFILVMPSNFIFNAYAQIMYFGVITGIIFFIAPSRLFHMSEWFSGRFSFQTCGFSVLTLFFVTAAACSLITFSYLDFFMPRVVYEMLTEYIFYFSVAPLVFAILFSHNHK